MSEIGAGRDPERAPDPSPVRVELEGGRAAYRPGEEVAGTVSWKPGGEAPEHAEVRLAWYTRGRGERDAEVVASQVLEAPAVSDRRSFRFRLPDGPYSFSGNLVSLVWTVEAVLEPGSRAGRADLVVSPTGREVLLHRQPPAGRPG